MGGAASASGRYFHAPWGARCNAQEDALDTQLRRARFESREVQQIVNKPAEPFGLRVHRAKRRRIRFRDTVDEILERRL